MNQLSELKYQDPTVLNLKRLTSTSVYPASINRYRNYQKVTDVIEDRKE